MQNTPNTLTIPATHTNNNQQHSPTNTVADNRKEKHHINVAFVGHVDAGKSSLAGAILLNSGKIDARTIDKVKRLAIAKGRESWWKAYFLDTNEDEQDKGKTVEVARESFELSKNKFTVLDAPGHKAYVPNMIQGATQADVALLVISARKGEFEAGFQKDGQTREHILLCKTLGVEKVVVVINKMDCSNWDQNRFQKIKETIYNFLKKSGFNASDIAFVPISAINDANVATGVQNECPWYKGETLLNILDGITIDRSSDQAKDFRLPVLDTMKDAGKNKIIGKVETGKVTVGDVLTNGKTDVKVIDLEDLFSDEIRVANTGDNVTIGVSGDVTGIVSGDILWIKNQSEPFVSQEFIAQYKIIDLPESRSVFSAGLRAVLHIHTAVTDVECTSVVCKIDRKKKGKVKSDFGLPGDLLVGKFKTDLPIFIEKYDIYPQLGRFTIRDEGKTICIGKIIKIKPI